MRPIVKDDKLLYWFTKKKKTYMSYETDGVLYRQIMVHNCVQDPRDKK